jgi:Zn-dependent peptidase ImmA (M78 family)
MDNPSRSEAKVVLRSKWETGRRFDLARLLGDRIVGDKSQRLFPATPTTTYRQKFQRAFAAELLCPYEALEDQLADDYSDEKQEDAANQFRVSPLTIRTILVNRGKIARDDLERDLELCARISSASAAP